MTSLNSTIESRSGSTKTRAQFEGEPTYISGKPHELNLSYMQDNSGYLQWNSCGADG